MHEEVGKVWKVYKWREFGGRRKAVLVDSFKNCLEADALAQSLRKEGGFNDEYMVVREEGFI